MEPDVLFQRAGGDRIRNSVSSVGDNFVIFLSPSGCYLVIIRKHKHKIYTKEIILDHKQMTLRASCICYVQIPTYQLCLSLHNEAKGKDEFLSLQSSQSSTITAQLLSKP
ncbi:hypothetical protein EUTSA_v10006326mg [Eutrema salsugineum]|uniref:Uncharacterized protein n=1 Tax=Eutrema salsugineum TaxID=72664 RepID=V4LX12_EUTSA|nr:hypothetical protein EUTSA_v10006326mg [Eutrema salsugineum]